MSEKICYFCLYKSRYKSSTEVHLRNHTKEKPFFCVQKNCLLSFSRQGNPYNHSKSVHKIVKLKKHQRSSHNYYFFSRDFKCLSDLSAHILSHTQERPYKCPYNNCKKFSLSKWIQNEHAQLCDYNPTLKNNLQKRHEISRKILDEGQFQCYFCLKNYTSKRTLFLHIKSHTGELKITCFGCKIQLNCLDLWKHRAICVPIRKLFMCPFCNCSKTTSGNLNSHIQDVHTKDNPKTKCYFCSASFHANHMDRHLATHTQEKAYECGYCSFSCAQHGALRIHVASKHRDTEEGKEMWAKLRRKCYFCSKYFASYFNLRNHMGFHTMETRKRTIC